MNEDVICSYYQCREYATKNLTVTQKFGRSTSAWYETWDIPYCDVHYEEFR